MLFFYFIKISKFALPGVMLMFERTSIVRKERKKELQSALNAMFLYCKSWDLEVNLAKTKITIFSNRKPSDVPKFMYNGQELDVDDSFVYLGTMFSYNGLLSKITRDFMIKLVKLCLLF